MNRTTMLCFAVLLAALLAPARVWAGSGIVQRLPGGGKPKNGVTVTIDTRWVDANGYRPVRIELANWPPGPAAADRTFRVVLQPRSAMWGTLLQRVTTFVEMPQGASVATKTVSVPQTGAWHFLSQQVYEDGLLLEDVSAPTLNAMSRNGNQWSEALPTVLLIDRDAPNLDEREAILTPGQLPGAKPWTPPNRFPDLRQFLAPLTTEPNVQNATVQAFYAGSNFSATAPLDDRVTLQIVRDSSRIEMLPPAALPIAWSEYTCFDLVVVRRGDLQELVKEHPPQWAAVRRWASTGGSLIVYDAALTSAGLAELDRLLAFEPAAGAAADKTDPGWRSPDAGLAEEELRGWSMPTQGGWTPPRAVTTPAAPATPKPAATVPAEPEPARDFRWRPLGLGRVVAVQGNEPFAPGKHGFGWILNQIGVGNLAWCQRHGLSFSRENNDFWNWTIPGVGQVPVGAFLIFISLFVIVIGPVNYWLLHRKRRLYLLLVTVPGGAALVTVLLFTYALLSDGLGMRVRVRSFTHIDQRQGEATTWSRQCYYAGITPSRGLVFPLDAAVYPLEQEPPNGPNQSGGRERQLVWDEAQRLAAGYLPSRTSCQFVVVRANASARGLAVHGSTAARPSLAATNNLGTDIEQVFLCDAHGDLFWAENVAAGASFQPPPAQAADVERKLGLAQSRNRPAFPPGYEHRYGWRYGFNRRYYGGWNNLDSSLGTPTVATSVLERAMERTLDPANNRLPPRSYVAIVRSAPEQIVGASAAREEASFHVVTGTW